MTSESKSVGVTENDAEYAASGYCLMSYVSKGSDIKAGDLIITSGSTVFPGDIMFGTVKSVFVDPNGLTKHAVIEPSEDVFKIKQVFVVTGFQGQDD